ncbi:MAG: pilus assembly protein PilM [Verrucomicrobiota bacterium]
MNTTQKESRRRLPFFGSSSAKPDQIVAIDLGSRTTKAVYLQRNGDGFSLLRYAIQDAPIYDKTPSAELLGEHLRSITQALEPKTKQVTLAIGMADSILRTAELPQMPVSEMRLMLKFNTKNYLQQELPDHVFDCSILAPRNGVKAEPAKAAAPAKFKVWVGGARNQFVNDLQKATRAAGLIPDQITLSALGPVNAFEKAQPESFVKEVIALVDIGFRNSTINILCEGELALSRVVAIGGDKITTGLSEALGISYAEAEGIKVGMPTEVESSLQPLVSPLGRELRASIDFFEHQQEKTVSQVYVSGGGARSEYLIQTLQTELMAPCTNWNPASFLAVALPPQQIGELEQIASQLTVALGAAASSF